MDRQRIVYLVLLTLGQMSCVSMQRSPQSGYHYWKHDPSESLYESRTPSRGTRLSEVQKLESRLQTQSEVEYYDQARPHLKSEKEKVEFLSQKDRVSQKRWLASRGLQDSQLLDSIVSGAIDEGDVVLGMSKEAVIKSWGDPEVVEVAGNPDYGNERWLYTHYEGTSEGYQKQERTIFFKKGKVIGWQSK